MNPPPSLERRVQFALLMVVVLGAYVGAVVGGLELIRRLSFPYLGSGAHVTRPAAALGVAVPALWYLAGRERAAAGRRVVVAILATIPSLALCVWGARAANALLDPGAGQWLEYRVAGYEGRGNARLVLASPPERFASRLVLDRGPLEDEREAGTPVWVLIRPGAFRASWIADHRYAPPPAR
jgi:hypothetical protein